MDDTFDLLPLRIDPQTKAISAPTSSSAALEAELIQLNATHRALLSPETPNNVPPPPVPVNPKRGAAVIKMREQGNAMIQKRTTSQGNIQEAAKLYSFALEMAIGRPPWEPSQLVRDEAAILFSNRAQAQIMLQNWPEGAVDAETSVELKPAPAQGKAWWRRGKCLLEMNRLDEAKEWVAKALEIETGEGATDLKTLRAQIDEKLASKGRK